MKILILSKKAWQRKVIKVNNYNVSVHLNEQEEKGKIVRAVRTKSIIDSMIKSERQKHVSVDWKKIYQKTRKDRL